MTSIWFGLFVLVVIWLSPIVWAWRTKQRDRILITTLSLTMPLVGFLISLIVISNRRRVEPKIGEAGVSQCEHCGSPYQLSDYADSSEIYCENCKKKISGLHLEQPLLTQKYSEKIGSHDTDDSDKRSFWLWPYIHNDITAKNANNQGLIASIWCAACLFVIFLINIFSNKTVSSPDLWELVDVAIFLLIASGIYKRYRVAPIAGLIFYFFPRLIYWIQNGPKNILFGLIITLAYITSIRGAFAYHRFKNDGRPFDKDVERIYDKEF